MAEVATKNPGTPLHSAFCFSYMRRGKGAAKPATAETTTTDETKTPEGGGITGAATATTTTTTASPPITDPTATTSAVHPYENSIKHVCTVKTVEEFWATYNYLRRPNDLPTTTDYHFFKDGIKPTWEDPSNAKGGKWIVRLPKGLASRYWEEVILAFIGAQFPGVPDGEICGLVVSIRYSEDILGVWNKTSTEKEIVDRIRDSIKKILQLPPQANMEYKPHQNSIQDKSSFRNTQVWKPKSGGSSHGVDRTGSISGEGGNPRAETRRSGSWGAERETKPRRDSDRAWR